MGKQVLHVGPHAPLLLDPGQLIAGGRERGLQAPPPGPTIFEQNQGRGLSKQSFKDRMTIGKGPDQIDLHYFGRGHTDGDIVIHLPEERIVIMGDLFALWGPYMQRDRP